MQERIFFFWGGGEVAPVPLLHPTLIFHDGIFCRFTIFFVQNIKIQAFVDKKRQLLGF